MNHYFLFIFICLTFGQVGIAGVVGAGGGPPPSLSEEISFQTKLLTINQEISEIIEVSPEIYSKFTADAAVKRPILIDGKRHAIPLIDFSEGRMLVQPLESDGNLILLLRSTEFMAFDLAPQVE